MVSGAKYVVPVSNQTSRCHREPSVNPMLGIADSEGHVTLHEYDLESVSDAITSLKRSLTMGTETP